MRRPFIFTSLGVVKGESKRGNRKCGPENYGLIKFNMFFGIINMFSVYLENNYFS